MFAIDAVDDDDENHPRLPSAPKWIFMLWELGRGTCSHDFFSMLSHICREDENDDDDDAYI